MRILGIGDADIDIYIEVEEVPKYDEKIFSKSTSKNVGGMVLNFLSCLNSLGNECEFVGLIGDDDYGKIILNFLKKFKIDSKNVIVDKLGETYYCYVILDKLGEKLLIIVPTNCIFIDEKMVKEEFFRKKTHVHTTSGDLDTAKKVLHLAKKNNVSASIDIENIYDFELLSGMLKNVDILFLNKKTFQNLGFKKINDGLANIIKYGPKMICLTKGRDGSVTFTNGKIFSHNAFRVGVKDTTGAGDCFAAGFIHGFVRNWSIERTTIFANAVASLSTTKIGGSSFRKSESEVNYFIISQKKNNV